MKHNHDNRMIVLSKWDYNMNQLVHYKNKYKHGENFIRTIASYLDL
jgi:hypothetical protein